LVSSTRRSASPRLCGVSPRIHRHCYHALVGLAKGYEDKDGYAGD
jgi:hypothetical protein